MDQLNIAPIALHHPIFQLPAARAHQVQHIRRTCGLRRIHETLLEAFIQIVLLLHKRVKCS